jgi:rRNA biogenesis protein RRP5
MAKAKRTLEDAGEGTSPKKTKLASKPEKKRKSETAQVPVQTPSGPSDEVDFPRGGGTSLTPAEVKTIRAEAQREANDDIFKVRFERMFCMCVVAFLSHPRTGSQGGAD